MDTETTSLDPALGRVIEIGAVAIINGRIVEDIAFSEYIDPGVPIPESSTAIHGITDETVAGRTAYPETFKAFAQYASGHLLLGYAMDFDMGMLRAEHSRANMPWSEPRWLCVRKLVRTLHPVLPDYSLDTVAAWLGIDVENRHSALGDSLLTARIFLALIPRLRTNNIRTLAEAHAASLGVEQGSGQFLLPAQQILARVDSYPYRHSVADVMSSPPFTIAQDTLIKDALREMLARKMSSIFVQGSGSGSGILTERDIMRGLDRYGAKVLEQSAGALATFPLRTINDGSRIYEALGLMASNEIRHLGVVNAANELVGALSQRDLLRSRTDKAIALTSALDDAASVADLAQVWQGLAAAARALTVEGVDVRDIAAIVSSEVCALTARAAKIAEAEFLKSMPAGLRYAVMVLGSGGRGESLLALDQDNAIVFDGSETGRVWLLAMASRMNAILNEVGVPYCKGKVMAMYPEWCRSASEWRKQVSGWLSETNPVDVMYADIFFDGKPVAGDHGLADDLRNDAIAFAAKSESFLKLLSLSAAEVKSPIGWFGKFATDEKGRLDLKRHGLMPIAAAARISNLRAGLHERSTLARLTSLRGRPDYPQKTIESLLDAQTLLMSAVLRQQLDDIGKGIPLSANINPGILTALERDRLKWALEQVTGVREILGDPV